MIYQGPCQQMVPHFEELGYHRPEKMDASDFAVEVASKEGKKLLLDPDEITERGMAPPPLTTVELLARYQSTPLWAEKTRAINNNNTNTQPIASHQWVEGEMMTYKNTWSTSFWVCLHREWTFFLRDRAFLGARLLQDLVLGICTGTIYWDLDPSAYNDRYGIIFSVLLTMSMQSMANLPIYYAQRSGKSHLHGMG